MHPMMFRFVASGSFSVILGATVTPLLAQSEPIYEDTFPYCACKAVASEVDVGSPPHDVIFPAAGGGFFALQTNDENNPVNPMPWTATTYTQNQTDGFVYDVDLTPAWVLVANGRGGVRAFDRLAPEPLSTSSLNFVVRDSNAERLDVRSVDFLADVPTTDGSRDLLVLGTNDFDEGGVIRLYDVDAPGNPIPLAELDVGAAVYCVEMTTAASSGKLTILVGLRSESATWTGGAVGSLLRFDLNLSAPLTSFGQPVAVWGQFSNPYGIDLVEHPTLCTTVRDIALDESASPVRAYVAGFSRGVFAFDLNQNGTMTELTSGGWPIVKSDNADHVGRATGLARHADLGLLAISYGPTLRTEEVYWGDCSAPTAADGSENLLIDDDGKPFSLTAVNEVMGIGLASVSSPAIIAFIPKGGPLSNPSVTLPAGGVGVSIRTDLSNPSSVFYIDAACDHHGLQVIKATKSGSTWSLARRGDWDLSDGVTTSSMDDVFVQNGILYAANEITVKPFNISVAGDLKTPLPASATAGGVLMSGFADSPERIYLSGPDGGVVFYDPDATTPVPFPANTLDTDGQCYTPFAYTFDGSGGAERWLVAVNSKNFDPAYDPDLRNGQQYNGSMKVYFVGDEDAPGLPGSDVVELGYFAVSPDDTASLAAGSLVGVHMKEVDVVGTVHRFAFYLAFGAANQEHYAGVMTLQGDYDTATQAPMTFTFKDKVDFSPIIQGEAGYADAQVGRITYDADNHRLYAAVGCKGVLWLDIEGSHAWHPVSMGCHKFTGDLAGATVIQVVPGPGDHVLAALLENGVAILDASSPTAFVENLPVAVHRLRFQATALWPTDDPGGWTYWVADGRGGVHKIEFPAP